MTTSKSSTKSSYTSKTRGSKNLIKPQKRQAQLLGVQIDAREKGRLNLKNQLDNAFARNKANRRSVVADLLAGQRTAMLGYDRSEEDATGNLGETTASSILNRAREAGNAMSEVSNLQGGETDRIKAMAASIRAMRSNIVGGVNDYASAITSINNSLGDLNTSNRTNINNALREQNIQDAQAFSEDLAGQQQAFADKVDLYGQKGAAHEQIADTLATKISKISSQESSSTSSSGTSSSTSTSGSSSQFDDIKQNKRSRKAVKLAKQSFGLAGAEAYKLADAMGQTFNTPITTIDQMNAEETDPYMKYTDAAMKENKSNLDELSNSGTLRKMKAPEGSKLRKKLVA
jgi:hypothetical protein